MLCCLWLWQPNYYNRTQHTSHMHMQFGQFLDHDISITPEAGFLFSIHIWARPSELDCCNEDFLKKDKKSKFPRCFNVPVTKKNFLGHSCFSFTRFLSKKSHIYDLLKMDHRSDTTCNRWKKPVEQVLKWNLLQLHINLSFELSLMFPLYLPQLYINLSFRSSLNFSIHGLTSSVVHQS